MDMNTENHEIPADKILRLALDVADGILKNGGEVSRVEETIERMCYAYGAAHVEVFSITSMINAAIRMPDGSYSSQLRRVRSAGTNLAKVERYNSISRKVCNGELELSELEKKIKEVKKTKGYSLPILILASALGTSSFALFFGGNIKDALVSFFIGMIISLIDGLCGQKLNSMAKTLVCSFVAALLSHFSVLIGAGGDSGIIMISAIMILVPGVCFGTAIRDLFLGDLLTGMMKILQAILSSFMIALGYMLATGLLGKSEIPVNTPERTLPLMLITALIASVAFAINFIVNKKHLPFVAVAGFFTWLFYYGAELIGAEAFICAFASTAFTAFFAEIFARTRKAPSIIVLIPGVVPTVPGGSLYYAMRYLMEKDYATALSYTLTAAEIGVGIACGIVSVSLIIKIFSAISKKIKDPKLKL